MPFLPRIVIVASLSLLLPIQASLAYARAVGMTAGSAMSMKATVVATVSLPEQASHAEQHDHHHNLDAGTAVLAHPVTKVKAASPHASHSQSGNACDNCAKCCLAGAVAPPLIWPQAANVIAARVIFSPTSETPSCFIPDGPERPPRCS